MNIKTMMRICFIVLLLAVLSAPVYAGGIGLYLQDGKITDGDWNGDYDFDMDSEHRDFGFAIDSNLATDRMFNYRLEFARSTIDIEDYNGQGGVDAELDGLVMNHNFGFGGMIAPNVRLWFGPEIRMEVFDGELDGATARDFDMYGFGVGATAGLNFNFPGRLTMSAKGGYVMMDYHGRGPNHNGIGWESSSFDVDADLAYLNFSFFFRTRPR